MRHPPADVIGQTHVAVVAARRGGHIDRLPIAIVCIGVRPVWVIAGMESPGAIEQRRCGAQRRRIGAAAPRQVGDHDGECQQRRDDDADDQFALCRVDRGLCRYNHMPAAIRLDYHNPIEYDHTVILDGSHGQRGLQISICRRKPRARFRQHGGVSSGSREEGGPSATCRGCASVG